MAQPLVRLAGGTASPYTQKMLALLRYRRVPYAITWGQIEQACEALGVAQPKPVFMPTFFFEEENGLKAVTDSELCYINREDIQALRVEYPELDARLKRFVNVGNIRLSKKNAFGKLFPEQAITESGMTKSQVEAEQRASSGTILDGRSAWPRRRLAAKRGA